MQSVKFVSVPVMFKSKLPPNRSQVWEVATVTLGTGVKPKPPASVFLQGDVEELVGGNFNPQPGADSESVAVLQHARDRSWSKSV